MTRLISIVVVYFADNGFRGVRLALEEEFKTRLEIGEHAHMGDAGACVIDTRVSDGFALHAVQQRLERKMPTVKIKMLERFRESWWRHYRWNVAIAIGGGIAVALIIDLLRPAAARLRDLLG